MIKRKKKIRGLSPEQILDKNLPTTAHFSVENRYRELVPKVLPKTGDTVAIVPGSIPAGSETCVIHDHMYYQDVSNYENWTWKPTKEFYSMQIVSFWINGFQYDFQIQPTPDPKIGVFVLIQSRRAEAQPGRITRTYETGGRKSRY